MHYVYVLKSKLNGRIYIGFSSDLKARIERHNGKKVRSTKAHAPWELVYYESYKSKSDAIKQEKRLKMHAAKQELKNRLKYSLK